MPQKVKKVVAVSTTFVSIIEKIGEVESELKQVLCILYFVIFKNQIEALLDSGSEFNAMSPIFAF